MTREYQINYSWLDKTLHRIAFKSLRLQSQFSEMEDDFFAKDLKSIDISSPVFITALPRAGTTLLLELCYEQGEFSTHNYRNMPFLFIPLLWSKFSALFGSSTNKSQLRAHGDGMDVNLDSPEAFEEVLWKHFFPDQYQRDGISCFSSKQNKTFNSFFRSHIKKVILLRKNGANNKRYISKNNLNICRLAYIEKLFPESKIVIPLRDPIQHAFSMLKQHKNFSELHKVDDFGRDYMRDIGHFDFGVNLKPINFNQWLDATETSPMGIAFWVNYWIAAYEAILNADVPNVCFFCYETFTDYPEESLAALADYLNLENREALVAQSGRITAGHQHNIDTSGLSDDVMNHLTRLHVQLKATAINT